MTATTSSSASAWNPDQIAEINIDDALPDLHLVTMTTQAGTIEGDEPAVRVPFVGADPQASVVAEGAPIPESEPVRDEVVVTTHKTAVLSVVSNELIRQDGAKPRLLASVQRSVVQRSNADFMAALAAETADFVNGGAAGTSNLDALGDLLTDLTANGAEPSHIIMRAADWKVLSKIKSATGSNMPLIGVGTGSVQESYARTLFGVPVAVTSDLPSPADGANRILVISKPDLVSAYGSLVVATSEHAYFGSDSVAIRATLRFGVKPSRPSRFGVLDGVAE